MFLCNIKLQCVYTRFTHVMTPITSHKKPPYSAPLFASTTDLVVCFERFSLCINKHKYS